MKRMVELGLLKVEGFGRWKIYEIMTCHWHRWYRGTHASRNYRRAANFIRRSFSSLKLIITAWVILGNS